ncbi:TIGR02452 family protein [marine bacterium AO1-C]|nr:TIGR02452 family protein [marine bacterium AO1-C]
MDEYLINQIPLTWDYKKWIAEFRNASKSKIGFRVSRKKVFEHTRAVIEAGQYNIDGKVYALKDYADLANIVNGSVFYKDTTQTQLPENPSHQNTAFYTIQADCVEVSTMMKMLGFSPVMLNMASATSPGGAVERGAGAQEENLFRRSNLYTSLYQFAEVGNQYGLRIHPHDRYPIPAQSGGIYSPGVLFFRSSEHTGYALLPHPNTLSVVTVAAIAYPDVESRQGKRWLAPGAIQLTKHKIRNILRISAAQHHDCLILSALGCGAYGNPPHHMARLFKEVLVEDDFAGRFKAVIFAIIDDHNAWKPHNPLGNLIPFQEVFN